MFDYSGKDDIIFETSISDRSTSLNRPSGARRLKMLQNSDSTKFLVEFWKRFAEGKHSDLITGIQELPEEERRAKCRAIADSVISATGLYLFVQEKMNPNAMPPRIIRFKTVAQAFRKSFDYSARGLVELLTDYGPELRGVTTYFLQYHKGQTFESEI